MANRTTTSVVHNRKTPSFMAKTQSVFDNDLDDFGAAAIDSDESK